MARASGGAGRQGDLERWLAPFLGRLGHKARRRMCPLKVAGLIGPGDRKSIQPMAERLGLGTHDRLHPFVSAGNWDAAPLLGELGRKADALLGGEDAVLVVDDTALPKKGNASVGVAPLSRPRFLWTPICPRRDRNDGIQHEEDQPPFCC
jgi:hypothetical protein